MKIKVYAGLSLDAGAVADVLPDALCAGPVRRGDLLADVAAGLNVVVILDGRFQQSLAVSPAEILDALRAGLRIYGAASMGALRAAELGAYGMIGFGAIYELVAASPWFGDDLVAQLFGERDGRSATVPYVNVHFGLAALAAEGAISDAERELLGELCRAAHFTERTWASVAEAIERRDPPRRAALAAAARRAMAHDQKRIDGLGVLRQVRADLAEIARRNRELLAAQRESTYHAAFDPAVELEVGILLGP